MTQNKSPYWKECPCKHESLKLIAKHHYIADRGTPEEKFYKIWRDHFIGFYECRDCKSTGEIDSWGLKYDWEKK